MLQKIIAFLKSQFSESDGTVSNTRVCMFAIIMFTLGWGTALVTKIHTSVTVTELDGFLNAATFFVTGITGTLYAINKVADVANNKTDKAPCLDHSHDHEDGHPL
jgi:predicted cation transporter